MTPNCDARDQETLKITPHINTDFFNIIKYMLLYFKESQTSNISCSMHQKEDLSEKRSGKKIAYLRWVFSGGRVKIAI